MRRRRPGKHERDRLKQIKLNEELERQKAEEEAAEEEAQYIFCTLCHDVDVIDNLITPCDCADARYWHYECLVSWIRQSRDRPCGVCSHGRYTDRRISRGSLASRYDYYLENPLTGSVLAFFMGAGLIELSAMFGLFYYHLFIRGPDIYNVSIGEFVALFVGLTAMLCTGLFAYSVDSLFREWAPYEDVIWFADYDGNREVPEDRDLVWEYHVGEEIFNDQQQRNQLADNQLQQQQFAFQDLDQDDDQDDDEEEEEEEEDNMPELGE